MNEPVFGHTRIEREDIGRVFDSNGLVFKGEGDRETCVLTFTDKLNELIEGFHITGYVGPEVNDEGKEVVAIQFAFAPAKDKPFMAYVPSAQDIAHCYRAEQLRKIVEEIRDDKETPEPSPVLLQMTSRLTERHALGVPGEISESMLGEIRQHLIHSLVNIAVATLAYPDICELALSRIHHKRQTATT